jgi:hypothetical protein
MNKERDFSSQILSNNTEYPSGKLAGNLQSAGSSFWEGQADAY